MWFTYFVAIAYAPAIFDSQPIETHLVE